MNWFFTSRSRHSCVRLMHRLFMNLVMESIAQRPAFIASFVSNETHRLVAVAARIR
jgi:hypothetical protein